MMGSGMFTTGASANQGKMDWFIWERTHAYRIAASSTWQDRGSVRASAMKNAVLWYVVARLVLQTRDAVLILQAATAVAKLIRLVAFQRYAMMG